MNINYNRGIIAILKNHVQHYDHVRYWKCREKCIVSPPKCSKIIYFYFKIRALIYLWYVKRCDAFNCTSTGADLFAGAQFKTPPRLPHMPKLVQIVKYFIRLLLGMMEKACIMLL